MNKKITSLLALVCTLALQSCKSSSPATASQGQAAEQSITMNLYYTGEGDNARKFMEEMKSSGTVDLIKKEEGNLKYDYFISDADPHTVLLIDSWKNQEAIDKHHASPMMKTIADLRNKYDLHMRAERYISAENAAGDSRFLRK